MKTLDGRTINEVAYAQGAISFATAVPSDVTSYTGIRALYCSVAGTLSVKNDADVTVVSDDHLEDFLRGVGQHGGVHVAVFVDVVHFDAFGLHVLLYLDCLETLFPGLGGQLLGIGPFLGKVMLLRALPTAAPATPPAASARHAARRALCRRGRAG